MDYINLKSVPKIEFAHAFEIDKYQVHFRKKINWMEIAYLKEGEFHLLQNGIASVAYAGDMICILGQSELDIRAYRYHCHHTVGVSVEFTGSETPDGGCIVLPQIIRSGPNSSRFRDLIDQIIDTNRISPERNLKCSGLFLQLLDEISETCKENGEGDGSGNNLYIRKAKRYIYSHLHQPISQKEIADFLGITPQYLCAMFRKNTGESVIQLIHRSKLDGIRILMEQENVSLRIASERYGFSDPNYVSRLYKQYYGIRITEAIHSEIPGK